MITLRKVSKIYTKEGNVNTALRDIDLHFSRGEFVAVTGKSGSGKSTLLNVISGLLSYESGEMYVEGVPTSSYTKEEHERYNFDYVSTIYQDYNILESFTVLENVEFALTSIRDIKERRRRALEIIERVGLSDRVKSRGSMLSGGEKQRTVIARAIAKDSPIILADEPTGNLDSKTAKDILDLIKEVSAGKLVIMVTHNYEDVKAYATRHIIIEDGMVLSDESLIEGGEKPRTAPKRDKYDFSDAHAHIFHTEKRTERDKSYRITAHDTWLLGVRRYASRPRQATLISLLLTVALVITLLVMGFIMPKNDIQVMKYVSTVDGRVIVANNDESYFDGESAASMCTTAGASAYVLQDSILDQRFHLGTCHDDTRPIYEYWRIDLDDSVEVGTRPVFGEVALRIPYTYKGDFAIGDYVSLELKDYNGRYISIRLRVSGMSYYVDNSKNIMSVTMSPELFNRYISDIYHKIEIHIGNNDDNVKCDYVDIDAELDTYEMRLKSWSYDDKDTYTYVNGDERHALTLKGHAVGYTSTGSDFAISLALVDSLPKDNIMSKQISLIFDDEAKKTAFLDGQREGAYRALDINAYNVNGKSADWEYIFGIMATVAAVIVLIVTIGIILVLAIHRLIYATKGDLAIFRTMGISAKTIKRSTYVHLFLAVLPAYAVLIVLTLLMYFTPMGKAFTYIGAIGSLVIILASVLLVIVVAARYNALLFREKIVKNLRRVNK